MASLGQGKMEEKNKNKKNLSEGCGGIKKNKINKTLPRGLIATIFVCLFFFFCNVILPYGHPRSRLKLGIKVGGWSWGYIGKKLKWSYTPNSYTWNNKLWLWPLSDKKKWISTQDQGPTIGLAVYGIKQLKWSRTPNSYTNSGLSTLLSLCTFLVQSEFLFRRYW